MRNNIDIDLAALTRYPHSLFSVIQNEEDRKRAQTDASIASRRQLKLRKI